MPADRNKTVSIHTVEYSGLIIELTSNSRELLKANFVKNKKKRNLTEAVSEPLKIALSFLDDYFRGIYRNIEVIFNTGQSDSIPGDSRSLVLNMAGYTGKEINVYRELLKIKPGETVSYSELASRSGIPRGARFAGNCMAGNRFPVIIPCHRVINKNGSMGNYTGGVEIKEFLLKHEMDFKEL